MTAHDHGLADKFCVQTMTTEDSPRWQYREGEDGRAGTDYFCPPSYAVEIRETAALGCP